jgi:long-chain fatty acid transport protein
MRTHATYLAASVLLALASAPSWATNGYLANGYGTDAEGVAGVGIALPQDALAAAANPAGVALVGNRVDGGLDLFIPQRSADVHGNGYGMDGNYNGNATRQFYIPNFGVSYQLSPTVGFGLAVYGNGGMDSDYSKNPYAAFGGQGSAGVDLAQLFVTPALAWKFAPGNSVGLGINLAYQTFSAKGLGAFASDTNSPTNLDNDQKASALGEGVRLGWIGQITPQVSLGATWASRTNMGKLNKYQGLFADQGSFDIPENFGAGLSFKATPNLTLSTEFQRILYSQVPAVSDSLAPLLQGVPLGASDGPGFGWQNINVYRIAAIYDWSDALTLRAGFSHSNQAVPSSQTLINILAPGVVQDHATLGASLKVNQNGELSFAYVHGFKKTVSGVNSIPESFGGGNADVSLAENLFSVSYGWKF